VYFENLCYLNQWVPATTNGTTLSKLVGIRKHPLPLQPQNKKQQQLKTTLKHNLKQNTWPEDMSGPYTMTDNKHKLNTN